MFFFRKSPFAFLQRYLSKLPGFSNHGKHSLAFLNLAQFLGVLNDNIFKLVLVFLLISIEGAEKASSILSAVGAIYVVPFLLFSSSAGVLADRFSKQKLLMAMKAAEIVIMGLALLAFGTKSDWGSCILLFLLSTHSALFGPSKYGIIPELVSTDKVSKANGLITSFTYIAMILGTFLASFITEISNRNFLLAAGFCLAMAFVGFISTFGIKETTPQGSKKQLNFLFIEEIYQTLVFCRTQKHLLLSILGSAYFLFIGAFTQLNIIPFAIQSLHLSEIMGGYLFLSTALGIALGAFLAGKASKKRVELGISCFATIGISLLFFFLALFSHNLISVIISLLFLGVFGGIFIVPFDSFNQVFSPHQKRGQVIAAANFLSFTGVLLASFSLYFLSKVLGLTSAQGFAVMGGITACFALFLILRLSDFSLHYFSRKVLIPFFRVRVENQDLVEGKSKVILVLQRANWLGALLLIGTLPNVHLFLVKHKKGRGYWYKRLFYSLHLLDSTEDLEQLIDTNHIFLDKTTFPCIFEEPGRLKKRKLPSFWKQPVSLKERFIYVTVETSAKTDTPTITFSKVVHSDEG